MNLAAICRSRGSHTDDPHARTTLFTIPPPHESLRAASIPSPPLVEEGPSPQPSHAKRGKGERLSGVEHLAWIEQVLRVERGFDAAHEVNGDGPMLLFHVLPLLLPDPMLAGAGAPHGDG